MTQLTNSRIAWFNGKFMPENQVLIPFRDRSWRFGDGVFDMTRTFNGRAFRLKEHIDRFYRSLRYLRLDPGMSPQEMIDVSEQLVVCNEHLRAAAGDWWVGQRVSRGVDPLDDEAPGHRSPNIFVECTPLPLKARARQFRDGLDVWTPAQRRIAPDMLSARAKTHNYLNMIVAEQSEKAHDPEGWAVLLDVNGNLAEGMGSNIFVVRDRTLYTPGAAVPSGAKGPIAVQAELLKPAMDGSASGGLSLVRDFAGVIRSLGRNPSLGVLARPSPVDRTSTTRYTCR